MVEIEKNQEVDVLAKPYRVLSERQADWATQTSHPDDSCDYEMLYRRSLAFAAVASRRLQRNGTWQSDVLKRQLDRLENRLKVVYEQGDAYRIMSFSKDLIRWAKVIVLR